MAKQWLSITGILTHTPDGTGQPFGKYVFQKTIPGLGNVPGDKTRTQQIRRWTAGTPSNTILQQPHRERFAIGVATWHGLTEPEKEAWRAPGRLLKLNRFQAFMRNWCRTQPLPVIGEWDGGTTTWDAGATSWDAPVATGWDGGATSWDGGATTWIDTPEA